MDDRELRPILEALLFVTAEPISLSRVCEVLEGVDRTRIVACLEELRDEYRRAGHGLALVEVAGGYQLTTVPEAAPWLRRLSVAKATPRLSKPALETLAIVAYKQPLTRPEIESIRGVDVAGVVKTLMDRRLVKIVGRKDVPGRPMMFGTTREFLQAFGLKDLSDLPTLRDFAEIARATDASVEPLRDDAPAADTEESEPIAAGADSANEPVAEALEQPAP